MRIAVVDDDRIFAQDLENRILSVCKDAGVASYVSVFDMTQLLAFKENCLEYDVVFLDIEMPLISGIELAKQINEVKGNSSVPYIIFVTAKDNLVFDALSTFPYHFMRKAHLEDLDDCISRLNKKLTKSSAYPIKSGREIKYINVSTILYLEKQGNYINYHTDSEILQERGTIDEKYADLKSYGFVRPNQSVLVNAAHITDFSTKRIGLSNNSEVDVSRNYTKSLKAEFNEWMVKFR